MLKKLYILILTCLCSMFLSMGPYAKLYAEDDSDQNINKYVSSYHVLGYVSKEDRGYYRKYSSFLLKDETETNAKSMIARIFLEDVHRINKWKNSGIKPDDQTIPDQFIDIFSLGYQYDENEKIQLSCSDKFINGKIKQLNMSKNYYNTVSADYFAWHNRAILKSRDILKNSSNMENRFYTMFSYYAESGLNDNLEQVTLLKNMIEDGFSFDNITTYLENTGICNKHKEICLNIKKYYTVLSSAEWENVDVLNAFEIMKNNGLLEYVTYSHGYFDIYNDGFFETVQVSKVNEFSILAVFEDIVDPKYNYMYPRYYKLHNNDNNDNKEYQPLHCTNNVYNGHLYIFPFNGKTYLINTTEVENKIIKIEIRGPDFFDTSYPKNSNIVTHMGTFPYINNILYEKIYDREPQSPLGDVDTVKDRRGDKILPEFMAIQYHIPKFNKNTEEEVNEYIEYLQKFSSRTLIKGELGFYNISTDESIPVFLAVAYYYNNKDIKQEALFMVNNKDLKIINRDIAIQIDNVISNDTYYKTLISKNSETTLIGFIQTDNKVFVVNVVNNKIGSGSFPIYYYKNEKVINDNYNNIINMPKSLLTDAANIDCLNTSDTMEQRLCSNRLLLTTKAYIEILYKERKERAEKNNYPSNIKESFEALYDTLQDNYKKECIYSPDRTYCIMDNFLFFSNIFRR